MDVFANDGHFKRFLYTFTLQLQYNRCARFSTQIIAHFTYAQSFRALAIYRQNAVACLYACPLCRFAFIRIHSICPQRVLICFCLSTSYFRLRTWSLLDDAANTAVFTGCKHTKVFVVLLRIIDGVRVNLSEHRIDGGLRQILIIERIDIVHIHLTQHVGEDSDTLVRPHRRLLLLGKKGIRNKE